MQKYIDKTRILIEALPYIKCFSGKTVVIKYGGSAMLNDELKKSVLQDIVLMKLVGISPVIVHGGGPEINKMLKKIDKQPEFINGLRVTDEETMDIVEMVLSGKINKEIVTNFQLQELNAVGICGKDGYTIKARKKFVDGQDAGLVGEVVEINTNLIKTLIQNDFIPVIAPIGLGEDGNTYNINADYAASTIAGVLEAEKLVFLTDIAGVLTDINNPDSVIPEMTVTKAKNLINNGVISGGMIPKVECCIESVEKGVKTVHILDGRIEHSLLLEIFTDTGIGTMINRN